MAFQKSPEARTELVSQFCRHVGIAFQVLNDLKDWQGDTDNKLVAGQDAAALRPTVLLALALKDGSDSQRAELQAILTGQQDCGGAEARIRRLREIFEACEVFDKAEVLVERLRAKADALLEEITDVPIRDLLRFFTETVLAKELPPTNLEANPNILVQLNTVTNGSVSLLPVIRM